jgi:hypothetical protein
MVASYELSGYQHPILITKAKELADKLAYAWVGVCLSFRYIYWETKLFKTFHPRAIKFLTVFSISLPLLPRSLQNVLFVRCLHRVLITHPADQPRRG